MQSLHPPILSISFILSKPPAKFRVPWSQEALRQPPPHPFQSVPIRWQKSGAPWSEEARAPRHPSPIRSDSLDSLAKPRRPRAHPRRHFTLSVSRSIRSESRTMRTFDSGELIHSTGRSATFQPCRRASSSTSTSKANPSSRCSAKIRCAASRRKALKPHCVSWHGASPSQPRIALKLPPHAPPKPRLRPRDPRARVLPIPQQHVRRGRTREGRQKFRDRRQRHAEIRIHIEDKLARCPQHPRAHRVAFSALRPAVDHRKAQGRMRLFPRQLPRYFQRPIGTLLHHDQDLGSSRSIARQPGQRAHRGREAFAPHSRRG